MTPLRHAAIAQSYAAIAASKGWYPDCTTSWGTTLRADSMDHWTASATLCRNEVNADWSRLRELS
jgi:hypothetical protein